MGDKIQESGEILNCSIALIAEFWTMKPHLKQTDANLHQLGNLSTSSYPEPAAAKSSTCSEIYKAAPQQNAPAQPNSDAPETFLGKAPTLPKFESLSFSSHPNSANSVVGMNQLKEIHTDVAACEAELQQIVQQIKDLYLEGPIVDGWLESHPSEEAPGAATPEISSSPRAGYRLCGLDAAGNMWFRPCPTEQLPSVSIAIARYQKLRQLLDRKQHIETRLRELL
jgi:hypothetical protein